MEPRQLGNDQNLVLSAFPAHSDLVQKAYSAPLEASMPNAAMTVARFGVQARNACMTSL
ncbi:hypothetical protein ACPV5L_10240 [Vibrio astriarenae]